VPTSRGGTAGLGPQPRAGRRNEVTEEASRRRMMQGAGDLIYDERVLMFGAKTHMGFGKDGRGMIIHQNDIITLDTLADNTALLQDNTANLTLGEDFRILKQDVWVGHNESIAAGDGPIYFGVANGELSIAEIAEQLTQTGPLSRNDAARSEQALRQVKILHSFGPNSDGGEERWFQMSWNPRWTYSNPEGWNFFAFNNSGGVLVTGTVIRFRAKSYGVWVT